MPNRIRLTRVELRKFDGDSQLRMYVAYRGNIFDISNCPKWKFGLHEGLHFPGQDLTLELDQEAPHGEEVFSHPCVKVVGILID